VAASQYHGPTNEGSDVYYSSPFGEKFPLEVTDGFSGSMEYDELKKLTVGLLDLPDAESREESNGILT
jgi:hypothetical protein